MHTPTIHNDCTGPLTANTVFDRHGIADDQVMNLKDAARRIGFERRDLRDWARNGIDGHYLPLVDRDSVKFDDLMQFMRVVRDSV